MADDEGKKSLKSSGLPVPNKLLDQFWSLAEGTEDVRLKSSGEIVRILEELQGTGKKPCKQLEYTLKRLIKGISSNRKWARHGFSLALTQVLRKFPQASAEMVMELVTTELKTSKKEAKSDQSSVVLGRVLVFLALVQSGKIFQAGDNILGDICKSLLNFRQEKKALHLLCTQALANIITQIDGDRFSSAVWPHMKELLGQGWKDCDPDTLLLLLAASCHKAVIGKKFLAAHWDDKQIVSRNNAENITKVLMASTADHPILHGVCTAVVEAAAKKPETLTTFWQDVIIGKLLECNLNRKYICLRLVPVALKLATSVDQVETILCEPLMKCVFRNLTNKDDVLHATAKQLIVDLTHCVINCEDGEMQVAMVMALLLPPCSYMFDVVSHTKTVFNMLHHLKLNGLEEIMKVFKGIVLGDNPLRGSEREDEDARRKWAVYMLSSAVSNKHVLTPDSSVSLEILQFLFLHAFFNVKAADKSVTHGNKLPVKPLTQPLRQALQDGFFKALKKISTTKTEKSKSQKFYIDTLYNLVKYSVSLLKSKHVSYIKEGKIIKTMSEVLTRVEGVREKEDSGKHNESMAFQLLFLQLALQLFTEPQQAEEALQDLSVCYEKAFSKKRRQSMKKSDEEPEWVEVVVELLLSLLSLNSHLNRVVVSSVFTMLVPHLTPAALSLILQVLKTGSEEESQLEFADDQEEDMEEESVGNGHNEVESESSDEESDDSDSTSDDSDDDNEMEVNEELRNSLKQALGKAAATSDDDDDDDDEMDDEAMFKLDDAIATAFRSMKRGSRKEERHKATQLSNFRMRCLDLVASLVSEQTPPSMLLTLCQPLLELLDQASRDKGMKEEEERLRGVFNKLTKLRHFPPDPELDIVTLPSLFQDLISYSTQVSGIPMVLNVASACIFVMKLILHYQEKNTTSPVKTRAKRAKQDADETKQSILDELLIVLEKSLLDFCEKRDSHLNHMLFHTMFERQPVSLWPLTQKLLELTVSDDIRVFCKTQVASMLSVMIQKNTVQQVDSEEWSQFSSQLISTVIKHLQQENLDEMKPRYLYELLLLIHRNITASQGKALELVPEEFEGLLEAVKEKSKAKDLRTVCNQLLARLSRHRGTANPIKQQQKEEKKAKKRRAELQNKEKEQQTKKSKVVTKKVKTSAKKTKSNGVTQ